MYGSINLGGSVEIGLRFRSELGWYRNVAPGAAWPDVPLEPAPSSVLNVLGGT